MLLLLSLTRGFVSSGSCTLVKSLFSTNKVNRKSTDPSTYSPGNKMYRATRRLVTFFITGTNNGTLPPMILITKRYQATDAVRIVLGTSSTTTVRVTPTHISPMMLEGMRLMKAHGGFRNRAPAANGAAISCNKDKRFVRIRF